MKHFTLATLIIMVALFSSCKKDEENPLVSITSPGEGQHFASGDIIQVTADITDDIGLALYNFKMVNGQGNLDSDFNWVENGTIEGDTYAFSSSWELTDEPSGNWQIQLKATDGDGKTYTAARSVVID